MTSCSCPMRHVSSLRSCGFPMTNGSQQSGPFHIATGTWARTHWVPGDNPIPRNLPFAPPKASSQFITRMQTFSFHRATKQQKQQPPGKNYPVETHHLFVTNPMRYANIDST